MPKKRFQSRRVFSTAGFAANRSGDHVELVVVVKSPATPHIHAQFAQFDSVGQSTGGGPADGVSVPLLTDPPAIQSAQLDRVVEALGRNQLHFGHCKLPVPRRSPGVRRVGLLVGVGQVSGEDLLYRWTTDSGWGGARVYFAERKKCDLCWGQAKESLCYGFLHTRQQIDARMAQLIVIASEEGLLEDPPEDDSADMLRKTLFQLYGGFDTPLLGL